MKKFTLLLFSLASTAVIMASTPNVVISGVYGGGGNSGAPVLNDYVELYNTTAAAVDMSGWTIYYGAATGTSVSATNTFTFPSGTSIGANGFLLLQASKGAGTQTNPYEFDIDISGSAGSNFSMAGGAGKVLLLSQYTNLSTANSLPTALADIQALTGFVDFVPYGSTSTPKVGNSTVDLTATTAATRIIAGTTVSYTPDMAADFSVVTLTASVPRNSKTNLSNSAVAMPAFSVPSGYYTAPVTVTISTATDGASVHYTTDGSDPTASSTLYTEPVTVSTTTTVKAIATKDGMDNSPVASATYTFTTEVANIAGFNALANNTTAKITGAVTVVYQNGTNLFVQDASGWVLIYGNSGKTYQNGDRLTGVTGTLVMYEAQTGAGIYYPELSIISSIGLPAGVAGDPAIPAVVNPVDLTNADLNKYVSVQNAEIAADVTYSTTAATDGTIVTSAGTMIVRDNYRLFSSSFSQGDKVNLTGLVRYYNGIQIYLLSIGNVTGINNPQFAASNVYAEDGFICINNLQKAEKISVYDLSGKLIFQTTATAITKIPATKGVYVVRVGAETFKIVNK